MEKPNFSQIVITLAQTAYVHLGVIDDPFSKKKDKNLEQAKFTIDMLDILKEKTMGNLTKEESNLLEDILYDLHMKYLYETEQSDNSAKN